MNVQPSVLPTEGLCPEAAEHARKGQDLYRRAADYHVEGSHQIAAQLRRQGRNAIDRAGWAQAVFEAEARKRAADDAVPMPADA